MNFQGNDNMDGERCSVSSDNKLMKCLQVPQLFWASNLSKWLQATSPWVSFNCSYMASSTPEQCGGRGESDEIFVVMSISLKWMGDKCIFEGTKSNNHKEPSLYVSYVSYH